MNSINRSARSARLVPWLVLLAACASSGEDAPAPATVAAQASAPDDVISNAAAPARVEYRVVPVVEGLENPWSMAFLPDGSMLVTERPGRLRLVRDGRLQPEPIAGVPAVLARGQGGLLEVLPHPGFAQNRLLYLTYSKPNVGPRGDQNTTAVIRARLEGSRLTDVREIFEAKAYGSRPGHFGSRLAFDRNGFLFITVGDRQEPPTGGTAGRSHPAQGLGTHHGKVIRLHDDGRVPADNPFVNRAGALPEIWSYGHRNMQGLAFQPETGDLWLTEHGAQGGDELNLVLPGRNYGWPVIGFGVNYGGARIHEGTAAEGMEQPSRYWVPSIATSGLMFYTGDAFPEWRGNLFVGGLAGQVIDRLVLNGRTVTSNERIFEGQGRVRDIRQGPDGFIYIALDARTGPTIVRLEPVR